MNKPIRTIAIFCLLLFVALMLNATYLQYYEASSLDANPQNRRVIDAAYSRDRGAILVGRTPIAESVPSDDQFDFQRTYPEPFKYAPITGFFTRDNQTGIERSQNAVLSGDDSRLFVTRLVDLVSNNGTQGGDVELTINSKAQDAAFQGINNAALGNDVEAAVVAIQPTTGRILAMASTPSFDPNKLSSHDSTEVKDTSERLDADASQPLLNRATQLTLPPGSTFKLVTAAAAIENKLYSEDDQVPGGVSYQLPLTSGDSGLIDNEGRDCGTGKIPFTQAMGNSCNTSFAAIAGQVGLDKMRAQAEAFGFNSDYLQDLRPQAVSVYPEEADAAQVGQTGIGQFDVRASPLQMAMVAAGIANGGIVMRPYIVDEIQSAESDVLAKTDPEELSQAVSADTARQLTDLMVYTVNSGTASPGAINGIQVAAKTGTAQSGIASVPPYAWFVSFAPAEDPQVAVAVLIQQADGVDRGEIAGGQLGGPIAKAVMQAVIK